MNEGRINLITSSFFLFSFFLIPGPGSSIGSTNGASRRFPSPQKAKAPAQASPQKQATLTSFFHPANKKRWSTNEYLDELQMVEV